MEKQITYSDAIEQVMLANGGFAPLNLIYKEIGNYKDMSLIKGKTPRMTIQERVQRDNRFERIGLGVYALKSQKEKLESEAVLLNQQTNILPNIRKHAVIQGMLLEIGNSRKEVKDTYTNDKSFVFETKKLGNLCTIQAIPPFTYPAIIEKSVRFADVIWFNERNFPSDIFEVENSTDFRDALVKFAELVDFRTRFFCVAEEDRRKKFDTEIQKNAFKSIQDRVKFLPYQQVEAQYADIKNVNFF